MNDENEATYKITYIAVAFTPEQVQDALNDSKYAFVMPCCTDENTLVELGGITVPNGSQLLLKEAIFVGDKTLYNSFVVSEDKTLTISEGATVIVREGAELVVYGVVDKYGALYGKITGDGEINDFTAGDE